MAWRIDEEVIRGELDNRVQGKVTGRIWLCGRTEPLRLELEGNPARDWAGGTLHFTNPAPKGESLDGLETEQTGVCGDMMASRKVRIPPEPVRAWLEQGSPGKESLPWGNSIYLEWFSDLNGRVVIESTRYHVQVSDRSRSLIPVEEAAQPDRSMGAMSQFMTGLLPGAAPASSPAGALRSAAHSAAGDEEPEQSRELRSAIEELKRQTRTLAGGKMMEGPTSSTLPLEVQHQFWKDVVAFESALRRPRQEILAEAGFRALPPDELTDEELSRELWALINALARQKTYLHATNHLSDRELYRLLVERVLPEETEAMPRGAGWKCRICIAEYGPPGDDDGAGIYLRYYADEETRARWAEDFGEEIPPHCDMPYDRDRQLPQ